MGILETEDEEESSCGIFPALTGKISTRFLYNPLKANAFYRAGFIESWGRGIQKIRESCMESGNEFPDFSVCGGDITISIKAIQSTPNNTQSTPNKMESGSEQVLIEELIIDHLKNNPTDSQSSTAEAIGRNINTVKAAFLRLKENGIIEWDGKSNRSGRWIIKDQTK